MAAAAARLFCVVFRSQFAYNTVEHDVYFDSVHQITAHAMHSSWKVQKYARVRRRLADGAAGGDGG